MGIVNSKKINKHNNRANRIKSVTDMLEPSNFEQVEKERIRPTLSLDMCNYKFKASTDSYDSITVEVLNSRFISKLIAYLRSVERMGDLSHVKFYCGNILVKEEENQYYLKVSDSNPSLISLETEPDSNGTFFIYEYKPKNANLLYSYVSFVYISNFNQENPQYYLLMADSEAHISKPSIVAKRMTRSDNTKFTSKMCQFICMLKKDLTNDTIILLHLPGKSPHYLVKTELFLDFSSDVTKAPLFSLEVGNNQRKMN